MIPAATAGPVSQTLAAIGTTVGVTCTDPDELTRAVSVLRARLGALDVAVSRFRGDSELARINARSGALAAADPGGSLRIVVGTTLAACLAAALRTERLTGGLVTATLGAELVACGYDADLDEVRARGGRPDDFSAPVTRDFPAPGRAPGRRRPRALDFDSGYGLLLLPAGVALDLGASAKAWAADTIAAELAATGSGGYLVNLGGDIAVAGPPPADGWSIGIRDGDGEIRESVRGTGQAFATSSTRARTWRHRGMVHHHILDPRLGIPARSRWVQVTCAAPDAVQANAASTAAIILDDRAPRWLRERGVPARLVAADGRVVTTPGWESSDGSARRAR
ncbi:FAD:protein FMN transferase [Gordonia crocea]|uniref:FAD:protein FMN transferase n=1 Tax=Gordonia crocea TaxID=589162 RepID=A0A7I9UV59_9ACTN|nr:FAD:protein FMN transferase [Gordonia crocea]GED97104.1 FAD:protein FMN transferase [Gordonia crocea]